MLLSIIVPVYNVENYLEQCVESLKAKELDKYEIILVNDGSTDKSLELCLSLEKKYSNIKIVDKKNGGLSSARNAGMKVALGKYLLFIDSDDYLIEDSIDKIIEEIKNRDIDVFMSGYYEVCDGEKNNLVEFTIDENKDIEDIKKQIFQSNQCIWTAWKFIVKKSFLDENEIIFKEGYLHEDIDYTTRIIINMKSFTYMSSNWYCYRISRAGSIMNTRKIKSSIHTAEIIIDLEKYMDKPKYNWELHNIVLEKLSEAFFTTIVYSVNSNKKDLKKLNDLIKENKFLLGASKGKKHKAFNQIQNILGFYNIINILKNTKYRSR